MLSHRRPVLGNSDRADLPSFPQGGGIVLGQDSRRNQIDSSIRKTGESSAILGPRRHLVDLSQSNSGGAVHTGDLRRIGSRWDVSHHGTIGAACG